MPATCSKKVWTVATKDWESCEMLKNPSKQGDRWQCHVWILKQRPRQAQSFTSKDGRRFTALWKPAWAHNTAVWEHLSKDNFKEFTYHAKKKWKSYINSILSSFGDGLTFGGKVCCSLKSRGLKRNIQIVVSAKFKNPAICDHMRMR